MANDGAFLRLLDSFRLTSSLPDEDRFFSAASRVSKVLSIYAIAAPLLGAIGTFVVCTVLFVSPARWIGPFSLVAALVVVATLGIRYFRRMIAAQSRARQEHEAASRYASADASESGEHSYRQKMAG